MSAVAAIIKRARALVVVLTDAIGSDSLPIPPLILLIAEYAHSEWIVLYRLPTVAVGIAPPLTLSELMGSGLAGLSFFCTVQMNCRPFVRVLNGWSIQS